MRRLLSLFRRSPAVGVVPEGEVVYAVGDVHGRLDLLARMLDEIRRDVEVRNVERATVVLLGDMVDRGPEGRAVLDLVRTFGDPRIAIVPLRGNHDDALLRFLVEPDEDTLRWMLRQAASLFGELGVGIEDRDLATPARLRDKVVRALGSETVAFLSRLPTSVSIGSYLFCHAGVDARRPVEMQTDETFLWGFGPDVPTGRYRMVVVHGHYELAEARRAGDFVCVDTGAWRTGRLSAVRLEGYGMETISIQGEAA